MRLFGKVLKVITWDWGFLLCFEVLYKTIGHVLIFPFFHTTMSKILQLSGLSFLSQETLSAVFQNPFSILLLFLWLIFFAFYFYLETVVILIYCKHGWQKESFTYSQLLFSSLQRSFRVFQRRNIAVLPLYLFLMPLLCFPFTGKKLISLPEYILDYIREDTSLKILFFVFFLAVNYLFFLYLFGLCTQAVEGRSFLEARKISIHLMKGKKWEIFFLLIKNLIFSSLLLVLAYFVTVMTLMLKVRWQYEELAVAKATFQVWYLGVQRINSILAEIFIIVVFLATISVLYYKLSMHGKDENPAKDKKCGGPAGNQRQRFPLNLSKRGPLFRKIIAAVFAIFILILFSETEMGGNLYNDLPINPTVVAHRGGALIAPENTIAALKETVNSGAEAAEIDIRQTKDDILVLLHDTSLKRIAGVNEKIWNLTYADLQEFRLEEPIPTLAQALQYSNRKLELMIELKVTGHESDLIKKTLQEVDQYAAGNQFSIASMNLSTLREVKETDAQIKTVYITPILFAEQYDLQYVDAFSVEASFLTAAMVNSAHYYDKKVYVWTINTEKSIKKALQLQPDGIITDNPYLAKYLIKHGNEDTLLDFWTEIFFDR